MKLKSHFEYLVIHRSPENFRLEFATIPSARYAPVRRQLLGLLWHVNKLRQHRGFELLTHHCLALRRKPVKVFAEDNAAPSAEQEEGLLRTMCRCSWFSAALRTVFPSLSKSSFYVGPGLWYGGLFEGVGANFDPQVRNHSDFDVRGGTQRKSNILGFAGVVT